MSVEEFYFHPQVSLMDGTIIIGDGETLTEENVFDRIRWASTRLKIGESITLVVNDSPMVFNSRFVVFFKMEKKIP